MKKPQLISETPMEVYSLVSENFKPETWIEGSDFLLQKRNKKIIFFHGYGANAFDLMSLATELKIQEPSEFYFPNGCCELPFELGGGTGRAWFEIPVSHMQKMMMGGQPLDLRNLNPDGLAEATEKAVQWIQKMDFKEEDIILGGFSQGAMLALEVALSLPKKCAGIILFSTTLIKEKEIQKKLFTQPGICFFQSHGEQDPILPFYLAEELYKTLKKFHAKGEFFSFRGGHEIPRSILLKATQFIDQLSS